MVPPSGTSNEPHPIFVAFAPNEEGRRFADLFGAGLRKLRSSGRLETGLKRYGWGHWL